VFEDIDEREFEREDRYRERKSRLTRYERKESKRMKFLQTSLKVD
jgi:hypothetical protein